ncbi:hypothetical protein [Corynebacterium pygosceleis]|uniref:Uncharacterized protein n=1 Tax=Corynebacterium pygosceleis TaxID=2800406 RepID=A0A9Q4GLM6_9CORY|nr:hypothetical protein [Corynebacterium pygosceleis]MCK7638231.1 hypothetical protein [Corynebacterium pygosceleis]MCK7676247.1 hypothetical protein [Corynebacterium pygosceleis]MCX7445790.1 hypothetical protein [Corynebacterium pygosceleis]MCX7469387.1 hypothetical protein [Corynebacterium pygosceleis]
MKFSNADFRGFRNANVKGETISQCLESQALYDHGATDDQGIVSLGVYGDSYGDQDIVDIANSLPEGQTLWAFSPFARKIRKGKNFTVTHVPAKSKREFTLKISSHLDRFMKGLPEGNVASPVRLPFPKNKYTWTDQEVFLPPLDERYTGVNFIGGVPFEFFADLRAQSPFLVVFCQDAINREKLPLPYFFRWKWSHRIPASVMVLNDPTLYVDDELEGGWWIGTESRDYVQDSVDMVMTTMVRLGLGPDDVVFVGMSAGGFSAMQMAAELPGSRAIVDIPRLTLLADGEIGKFVKLAVKACFGVDDPTEVDSSLRYRIDVLSRFVRTGNFPEFLVLQNTLDEKHYKPQCCAFRSELSKYQEYDPKKHRFIEYSQWNFIKGGHFPLKENAFLRILFSFLHRLDDLPAKLEPEMIAKD